MEFETERALDEEKGEPAVVSLSRNISGSFLGSVLVHGSSLGLSSFSPREVSLLDVAIPDRDAPLIPPSRIFLVDRDLPGERNANGRICRRGSRTVSYYIASHIHSRPTLRLPRATRIPATNDRLHRRRSEMNAINDDAYLRQRRIIRSFVATIARLAFTVYHAELLRSSRRPARACSSSARVPGTLPLRIFASSARSQPRISYRRKHHCLSDNRELGETSPFSPPPPPPSPFLPTNSNVSSSNIPTVRVAARLNFSSSVDKYYRPLHGKALFRNTRERSRPDKPGVAKIHTYLRRITLHTRARLGEKTTRGIYGG